jgi:hypothetical protein
MFSATPCDMMVYTVNAHAVFDDKTAVSWLDEISIEPTSVGRQDDWSTIPKIDYPARGPLSHDVVQ